MSSTTSRKKRIALIDADGILFAAALGGETRCGDEQLQMLPLPAVVRDCWERIEAMVEAVEAEDAFVILSDRRNFRFDILPSYKSNRKGGPRPLLLDQLRGAIVEEARYPVLLIEGLEADDVCGISAGKLQLAGRDPIIVSPDKDLLQIPGKVYQTVATNSGTKGVPQVIAVTEEAGDEFHIRQTLAGDPVDGYKGCPGIGNVKARQLIERCREEGLSPAERWKEVVKLYEEKGLTEEDALVQARVARILRFSDWDAASKAPILWEPPR
jgi:DNA polymerase-1